MTPAAPHGPRPRARRTMREAGASPRRLSPRPRPSPKRRPATKFSIRPRRLPELLRPQTTPEAPQPQSPVFLLPGPRPELLGAPSSDAEHGVRPHTAPEGSSPDGSTQTAAALSVRAALACTMTHCLYARTEISRRHAHAHALNRRRRPQAGIDRSGVGGPVLFSAFATAGVRAKQEKTQARTDHQGQGRLAARLFRLTVRMDAMASQRQQAQLDQQAARCGRQAALLKILDRETDRLASPQRRANRRSVSPARRSNVAAAGPSGGSGGRVEDAALVVSMPEEVLRAQFTKWKTFDFGLVSATFAPSVCSLPCAWFLMPLIAGIAARPTQSAPGSWAAELDGRLAAFDCFRVRDRRAIVGSLPVDRMLIMGLRPPLHAVRQGKALYIQWLCIKRAQLQSVVAMYWEKFSAGLATDTNGGIGGWEAEGPWPVGASAGEEDESLATWNHGS